VLIESILNLANCKYDIATRIKEFTRIAMKICEEWSAMIDLCTRITRKMSNELPFIHAQYLCPLILLSRTR
jgi:hypothetical protein